MDMKYATVPIFGGENKILYTETNFSYVVSDQNHSVNHPIYVVDKYLGFCILTINEEYKESMNLVSLVVGLTQELHGIQKIYFN